MDAAMPIPRPLRIVICPWLAFGHLLPYLDLAERLASRGHRVSFVSTPRNLKRLPPAGGVDLVPLPLPRVEGLPDGAESTNAVSGDEHQFELLWKAFDGLAAPFAELLAAACADEAARPDWVVADTFHHWAAAAAADHKVPCVMLLPSASMLTAGTPQRRSVFEGPDPDAASEEDRRPADVPRYEWEMKVRFSASDGASGMSILQRCALTAKRCTIMAMRSCVEWEPDAFPLAASLLGKPLVPLGLLPPRPDGARRRASAGSSNEDEAAVMMRWLDAQPAGSVLYVALGSEVPLPVGLARELAHGLDLAGTRFLWAFRKPAGAPDADALFPPGFPGRGGLVATGWVPQLAVLAHVAVGAFLTHCGRNSLAEGLLFGRPLVMLPIFGDQGPNARLMEAKKVGVQVSRDESDGSFDRHGVAAAVRAVMVDGEARRVFLANAGKVREMVADQELHERYVDEFVERLRSHANTMDGGEGNCNGEQAKV